LEFGPCGAVVISLKQMHVAHAMQAALAASAYPTRSLQKFVIVVDEDVDPSDIRQVLFALALRSEPEKYDILRGIWGADLDPALSPEKRAFWDFTSSSVIILACKPYHWIKDFPASVRPDPEIQKKLKEKWGHLLR
jgi:3-polyprenyl-4-hydroxybenzoate decarboxylase